MSTKKRQSAEARRASLRNEEITRLLEEEGQQRPRPIKMVIIGQQGCGKSAFINAARLIRTEDEFPEDYCKSMKSKIFTSIVELMQNIIRQLEESDAFDNPTIEGYLRPHILRVLQTPTPFVQDYLYGDLSNALGRLWEEELIHKKGYDMVEKESNLIEFAARHYLNDLLRISGNDYIPSPADVVKLHVPTNGLEEATLDNADRKFSYFEVGHMISDRRKWLPYLDNVNAIAFMVPISKYDSVVSIGLNPIQQALQDFKIILRARAEFLQKTKIFLLFNGADKFKEKLRSKPLKDFYPEFDGSDSLADPGRFMMKMFLDLAEDEKEHTRVEVYAHLTASLDQVHMRLVLGAIHGQLYSCSSEGPSLTYLCS